MRTAAVILAAGGSTRMGSAKQLLRLPCGRTMPRRAADVAWAAGATSVVVVLGAYAPAVAETLLHTDPEREVELIVNEQWQLGIGSSIVLGVEAVDRAGAEAVLLMLADQPSISVASLQQLVQAAAQHGASAARYAQTVGVPACLKRQYFSVLRALPPEAGAQRLLRTLTDLVTVDVPEAASDVDTPADAALFALR